MSDTEQTVSALEHQLAVLSNRERIAHAEATVLSTVVQFLPPGPLPAPVAAEADRLAAELAEVRRFTEAVGQHLRAIREQG
jgi:hypothetical protein